MTLIRNVPPFGPAAQPLLPISHQPKQNQAEGGTNKIEVNPTQLSDQMDHPVNELVIGVPVFAPAKSAVTAADSASSSASSTGFGSGMMTGGAAAPPRPLPSVSGDCSRSAWFSALSSEEALYKVAFNVDNVDKHHITLTTIVQEKGVMLRLPSIYTKPQTSDG